MIDQVAKPSRVALVVDNPLRDLPGLVLVAAGLARQGARCYLVPLNLQRRELWALSPQFVLLNYLRINNQALAGRLLRAGVRIGVLDTEGGVFPDLDAYARTMASDRLLRHRICCFLSWGPRLAEHACQQAWYRREQVSVTGAPRYDYYATAWRQAALRSSAYAQGFASPIVLVNGNFPVANPQFQTPEQEVDMLIRRFGYDRDYALRWQRIQKESLLGLAELTNRLGRRFPQVTFIYRPHPFERAETYRDLLERRDNLHLIKQGTVDGWILRAAAVIQRSCSTAIDAGLAGVPALSPRWIPTPVVMESAEAVSVGCATVEELDAVLEAILQDRFAVPETVCRSLDRVIADWFFAVDGRAYQRVVDSVLACLGNGDRPGPAEGAGGWYGAWQRLLLVAATAARRVLRGRAAGLQRRLRLDRGDRWAQSEKFFDAKMVGELVEAVQADFGRQGRPLQVRSAIYRSDYQIPYQGRSVVVGPA